MTSAEERRPSDDETHRGDELEPDSNPIAGTEEHTSKAPPPAGTSDEQSHLERASDHDADSTDGDPLASSWARPPQASPPSPVDVAAPAARVAPPRPTRRAAWATRGIVLANLFVFLTPFMLGITPWRDWYQLYHPLAVEMGAVAGRELTLAEPWRWILANFLHAGAIHLACNMVSLWSVGRFLETFLGARRFLAVYVLAALGATITSSTLGGEDRLALGASGAVLGVAWGVFVLLYRIRDHLPDGVARRGMIQLGILLTASLVVLPIWFPVDNWGHIGGSVVGGVATALAPFGPVRSRVWAWFSGTVLSIFVLVGTVLPAWFAVEVVQGGRSRPAESAVVEPISLEVTIDSTWVREDEGQQVTWTQLGVPKASVRWIGRRAAPMGSVADHEAMLAEQVRNGSISDYALIYKEDRFGDGVGGVIAAYAIDFPGDGAASFFGGQPAHRSLRYYRFFSTPFGSAMAVYYGQDHEADRRYGLEFVESVRPRR